MEIIFLGEFFGILGSLFLFLSFSKIKDLDLIFYQGISNLFWLFHYFFLEAHTGLFATFFALIRNLFVFKFNKFIEKIFFFVIFIIFSLSQVFFIKSYLELFPIISILGITYGVLFLEKNKLSLILFSAYILFIIYSIFISSISLFVTSLSLIIILSFRFFRIRFLNR